MNTDSILDIMEGVVDAVVDAADEVLALAVVAAGTTYAGYMVYTTGEIPEFFAMGFGMVLAFYFGKKA